MLVPELEGSKSLVNRLAIIQMYERGLSWAPDSTCEDVCELKEALRVFEESKAFQKGRFFLGSGGTSFRFFSVLVSRFPGTWNLVVSDQLRKRPSQDLIDVLKQMGVKGAWAEDCSFVIKSNGWKIEERISVSLKHSTQFASALILNTWNLERDLELVVQDTSNESVGYLQMTLDVYKRVGGVFKVKNSSESLNGIEFLFPKLQKPRPQILQIEVDFSSAWALVACYLAHSTQDPLRLPMDLNFSQPDFLFLEQLHQVGLKLAKSPEALMVSKQDSIVSSEEARVREFDTRFCPDVFPCLVALLSVTPGSYKIFYAKNLVHKESDRLSRSISILKLVGVDFSLQDNFLLIDSKFELHQFKSQKLWFDCESDHRLAFAMGVLLSRGLRVEVMNSEVVKKSFPNFWTELYRLLDVRERQI